MREERGAEGKFFIAADAPPAKAPEEARLLDSYIERLRAVGTAECKCKRNRVASSDVGHYDVELIQAGVIGSQARVHRCCRHPPINIWKLAARLLAC